MDTGNRGFSESGLRRLRDVLARHVESRRIPGLVALVSRGGQTHVEALGKLPDRRVRTKTRMIKRSNSKYQARGPNVDRRTYKATTSIDVITNDP
ncbi:hypothetical protein O7626_31555 [Micromonospora sp. WMMD1102]|uniref:hypothetical protein n=1 Tax=Micromonospora sp. WMMD1102 TaxID=3016105 RepID=UPI002414F9CB|nr:hypothetical protein [Micromonospora sp. WMMD1102]MDG4790404.1 hypothetical protein [Micromonospora sp. WMMD1102]